MLLDQNDLTLLYCLKDKSLRSAALRLTKKGADLFPARQRPHLALIWTVYISKLVQAKKTGKLDKRDFVAAVLEKMKTADILEENKKRLQEICNLYMDDTFVVDLEQGKQYLNKCLDEAAQRALSRAVATSKSFSELTKLVEKRDELKASIDENEAERQLFVNPLMQVSKYLKKVPKFPMGVAHFDKVTNGGMSAGEVCLVAGLSGSGKTVSAVQFLGAQLIQGNCVQWATYEQPFDGDLMQRLVSFITGYSLDDIRGLEFEELPEEVQHRFNAVVSTSRDNLIATDFTNNDQLDPEDAEDDGSAYSIEKRTQLLADKGKVPSYIIVDWLGAAVARIAASRGVDIGTVTNYIALANEFLTGLVRIAKRFSTRVIVFHQLDPALKKAPPSRKPTSVELQFIKSASNWVDYAIVMGRQDENHRCWFICDKCRKAFPSECVIELDGAHARFRLLQGYAPTRKGNFVNITETQEELEGDIS